MEAFDFAKKLSKAMSGHNVCCIHKDELMEVYPEFNLENEEIMHFLSTQNIKACKEENFIYFISLNFPRMIDSRNFK